MTTATEAFSALRKAGLKHADPDLVKLFDIDAPDYVSKARASKPDLFNFDARTASREDVDAALNALQRDAYRARAAASAKRALDALSTQYAGGR